VIRAVRRGPLVGWPERLRRLRPCSRWPVTASPYRVRGHLAALGLGNALSGLWPNVFTGYYPDGRAVTSSLRKSGAIASTVGKSDLRNVPVHACGSGLQKSPHVYVTCSNEGLPVNCAKDYWYLKATIGSTRIARRAGI